MYRFTRVNQSLYPSVREIFEKSFGYNYPPSKFESKHNTSCFGLKDIGIIAQTEDGDNAAYYGAFPIVLRYDNQDYLVAQSGETMTSPDHRKKGLFVNLAKQTYELARQEGIQLVYGFPNQFSYPGFKNKLDWVFEGNMQTFTIKTSTLPLSSISSKFILLRPLYNKLVQSKLRRYEVEPNADTISGFDKTTSGGHIKKDLNFFSYKLLDPANYLLAVDGFTLLVKNEGRLTIGAVAYFEQAKTETFLKAVKTISKVFGCSSAILSLSENHWLYKYLLVNHTPTESLPIGFFKINSAIDIAAIEFTQADYDTF